MNVAGSNALECSLIFTDSKTVFEFFFGSDFIVSASFKMYFSIGDEQGHLFFDGYFAFGSILKCLFNDF
jgi:hypothetical protein